MAEETIVEITSVDLDGRDSVGHYIDDSNVLRSVNLTYGEALAMQKEFQSGSDSVKFAVNSPKPVE